MPEANLAAALTTALEAVALAREILLAECARTDGPRGEIGHCPADDEAEWAIREHLGAAFPDFGYLGEETGTLTRAPGVDCVWIVDPNDGTRPMQRGYRGHAISIGLIQQGVPVLGVVCAVDAPDDRGDLVAWAEGCGPIRRNGLAAEPVAWPPTLGSDDIVCVSLSANRNPVGNLAAVAPARFLGMSSIAYRMALVAMGECAATVSLQALSAWDFAAGHALVRAAGGVVVDERGAEMAYTSDGQSHSRRIFAGGQAVVDAGDALGALVEFKSAEHIGRLYPDGGPRRLGNGGPHDILAGQPTDDSELALMLAQTLVENDRFSQEAVARAYARWFHGWTHAKEPEPCGHGGCRPFDVGNTTSQALRGITADDMRQGRAASRARASANAQSQANGALMRISPLGIWGALRDAAEVATAARTDAQLTHPHPVCQDASAVFAVTLSAAIRLGLDPRQTYAYAVQWSRAKHLVVEIQHALAAAEHRAPADFLTQQGWLLIALQNAFFELLHAPDVEEAVVRTVRRGGDTDTNAAICGALVGAVYGRAALPAQWPRMVLTCRPMPGQAGVKQPRPAVYWPVDALVIAERLVTSAGAKI
ncbi:MAG: ADP-ribosylglycohydrolase family protein [Chloroflexi bacterium]|nr:ADP-ribosylglycohydrolase family protein [Chloroflexota bacterium]